MVDLFVEIFPVEPSVIPPLAVFTLTLESQPAASQLNTIGNRLARRFRRAYGGLWLFSGMHLITDTDRSPMELTITADLMKSEQQELFAPFQALEPDTQWQPPPEILSDVVLRTNLASIQAEMQTALSKLNTRIRNARIERDFRSKGWAVADEPAVSLSIASRIIYDQNLQQYAGQERDLAAIKEKLTGLTVIDRMDSARGQVLNVVGPIAEHRERLLDLAANEAAQRVLAEALDGEWIVKVKIGREEYEYLASALDVQVRLGQVGQFGLDVKRTIQTVQMKPADRANHVRAVSDVAKQHQILGNGYNSRSREDLFFSADFEMNLRFDENRVRPYNAKVLADDFTKCGVYSLRKTLQSGPMRVCVVNTLSFKLEDFIEATRRYLKRYFNFEIDVIRERQVRVVSKSNLESAVRVVEKENPDIILAFFADDNSGEDDDEADFEATASYVKSLTLGRGIPTHIIDETTLNDPDAMAGIILSVLGKTGNAPFVLAEPMEGVDFVVGLDIVRDERKSTDDVLLTAIARVYLADGQFQRYRVRQHTLQGEALPYVLIRDLFPQKEFKGKRIVLHHDGPLPEDLLAALTGWGQAIGATFYLVEIVRYGAPRLYGIEGGIIQPPWGSAFKLSDREALLVSSLPDGDITPQPLHIRLVGDAVLPLTEVLRGVLVFTVMAYDSVRLPKLPVTVVNADEVDYWLGKGGTFGADEGSVPFWL